MGIFDRLKNLAASHSTSDGRVTRSLLHAVPGDIIEASLTPYEVVGSVHNAGRNATMLTIKSGNQIRYLHVEQREDLECILCSSVDIQERPDEIPGTLTIGDVTYRLDETYNGHVLAEGNTPFQDHGEQHVWDFISDDYRYFRIEWQDNRFQFYEGEKLLVADVQFLPSS